MSSKMPINQSETKDVENNVTNKFELVAPEGGWGYMVALALIINFICLFSHMASFGMLYNDFLLERGEGTGGVTIIMAVSSIIMSFSGILTNIALKKFTLRQVGVFGAFIYTTGWVLIYFVEALYQMIFTNGILQGLGLGVITTVTFASFNIYFVKKRVMVLSICQMVVGVASMLYPLFLEQLLKEYGFRGSILINAALIANTIFATSCFQPVEWHAKRTPLYNPLPAGELGITVNEEGKIPKKVLVESSMEEEVTKSSKWKSIVEYMDLTLLGDAVYMNITIGVAIGMASDVGFFLLFPLYLYHLGFETSQVATCLFLVSAADLVSRALLAVISKFHHFTSRNMFFFSIIGSLITKFIFLQCSGFWTFVVLTFLMGLWRGPMMMSIPLIYAEYCPEKFTAAYGLSILFIGNGNTLILPAVGYLRDLTQSYLAAFYAFTFLALICILPWCYEYWFFSRKRSYRKK